LKTRPEQLAPADAKPAQQAYLEIKKCNNKSKKNASFK